MAARMLVAALGLAATACAPAVRGAVGPHGVALTPAPEVLAAVDSIARAAVLDGKVVGIAVGISAGGRMLHSASHGVASPDAQVPVTDSTVFRIGSIAKQMTAAAVLRLEQDRRLSVNDPIGRHLDDVPPAWAGVTVHHLLTHTSGIPSYTDMREFWDRATEYLSVTDRLAFVEELPLAFAPGAGWTYSNTGYLLLGRIIERTSGMEYARYVEQALLAPLGLRDTGACADDDPRLAHGFVRRADAFSPAVSNQIGETFADGDLCSSARDLLRWSSALAGGAVVPRESYRRMITPARLQDGRQVHYGYGFDVMSLDGVGVVAEHGGAVPGFRGHLAYYPDHDVAIAVLTNTFEPVAQLAKLAIERRIFEPLLPEVLVLELPQQRAAQYHGTYDLYLASAGMGPFAMRIFESDGRLMADAEGTQIPLLWQGGHEFVDGMELGLRLNFEVVDGRATELTMMRAGLEFEGRRNDAAATPEPIPDSTQ